MKSKIILTLLALSLITAALIPVGFAQPQATAAQSDLSPWTTWFKKPLAVALWDLYLMRQHLDKYNLVDTYKELPKDYICPEEAKYARTADGTCNNLKEPAMGAANIRFGRNVPLEKTFPESDDKLLSPNPREISRRLLTRKQFIPVPFLNLLAASWIQFQVHDWFSHADNQPTNPFVLDLLPNDPFSADSFMIIPRTRKDPTAGANARNEAPTYVNENTHWWDGSQIYGSDQKTQDQIRSKVGGKLRLEADRLPLDSDNIELTGFKRNWWLGLSMLHNLFVLEHNSIADKLKDTHPEWNDQKLFDVARLVNTAVMAKIHTVEWTPAILANDKLKKGMQANWYGHILWQPNGVHPNDLKYLGLVGGKTNDHGVPYSLTEEFVSVYRLHSLLPEDLSLLSLDTKKETERVSVVDTRDELSHQVTDRHSMADLFYSFGRAHPGALTLHNFPRFLQDIKVKGPIATHLDMGTVDILRDRERGVPRYNEFRRQINLKPITSFEQLNDDPSVVKELKEIYGNDVERIDLLIGCLAESHRPEGFGFGETQFQIFILMASRRLQADRFFTEDYNAATYTKEGLEWIDKATMASIILRHYDKDHSNPALERALDNGGTAFNPWKE